MHVGAVGAFPATPIAANTRFIATGTDGQGRHGCGWMCESESEEKCEASKIYNRKQRPPGPGVCDNTRIETHNRPESKNMMRGFTCFSFVHQRIDKPSQQGLCSYRVLGITKKFVESYLDSGEKLILTPLTQCLSSLGFPNLSPLKMCPRCPPQLLHTISVLIMPRPGSGLCPTASGKASQKAGHPHPESNLWLAL